MKLAFALLAHQHPDVLARLLRILIAEGHQVSLHYDLSSGEAAYRDLVAEFGDCPQIVFADRVRVGWGEWSIVQATLNALQKMRDSGWNPDYVYLLSGADFPIRGSRELLDFLEAHQGTEFIESVPSNVVRWVRGGPQEERYLYRYFYNWREQPLRFRLSLALQKWLRLKRPFARGMEPHMGSQWWVLTWPTLLKIMDAAKGDVLKFFRTTLIPDELFFQTMIRHVGVEGRILSTTLTMYQFSDYGVPVVYHDDHEEYLSRQPFFFARKVSPFARGLYDSLERRWHDREAVPPIDAEAIGKCSDEYESFRLRHRHGLPGRTLVGVPGDWWSGPLKDDLPPFFCVAGASASELRAVQSLLAEAPGVVCHGELFHPERIRFAGDAASCHGWGSGDVKRRDESGQSFLVDVMTRETRGVPGYLLPMNQGGHFAALMTSLSNVGVIYVRGDPLVAFLDALLTSLPPSRRSTEEVRAALEGMRRHAAAQFEQFVIRYLDYQATLERQLARKNAAHGGWVVEVNLGNGWTAGDPIVRWSTRLGQRLGVDLHRTAGNDAFAIERMRLADLHELADAFLADLGLRWPRERAAPEGREPAVPEAKEPAVAAG